MTKYPKKTLRERTTLLKEEAKRKLRVWRFRREARKTYRAMERRTGVEKVIRRNLK